MSVSQIYAWWVKIREYNCSCIYGFTFGSRFCIYDFLQVNCAGVYSVTLLTSTFIFLRFLLYCKPHLIHLISLFISLITLWSHLFGTDPERETQYSCLAPAASAPSSAEPLAVVSRGPHVFSAVLPHVLQLHHWQLSCFFRFPVSVVSPHMLQFFLHIYFCSVQNTSILQNKIIRWELMSFAMPSREKGNPSTRARRAPASTQDQGCTHQALPGPCRRENGEWE